MERESIVECSSCKEQVRVERRPYDSGLVISCDCAHEIDISPCVGQNKLFEAPSGKWTDMEVDGTTSYDPDEYSRE